MQRGYTPRRFLDRLAMMRAAVPGLAVTTDVIVGFPGETEADFRATLDVMEDARFDGAYMFVYSPRPGTPAAAMAEQVEPAVAGERFARLADLQQRLSLARNQELVGRTVEVLTEGPSRKDPGMATARTRTNKVVHVPGEYTAGTFLQARARAGRPQPPDGDGGALRPVAALLGPTASGKSEVALAVAEAVGAEIVSVDSMQVYRGLDLGTAKPTPAQQARVRHHLLDLADPVTPFSVAEFQRAGREALAGLARGGVPALIVGGSGLHFRALVDPLEFPPHDPEVRREVEALARGEALAALLAADPAAGAVVDVANPRPVARALEVYRLTGLTPAVRRRERRRSRGARLPALARGGGRGRRPRGGPAPPGGGPLRRHAFRRPTGRS